MALLLGKKPLSNAEKQKRFRARKKAQGLKRHSIWADNFGFIAKPTNEGAYPMISFKKFERELLALLTDSKLWEKEIIYVEILEYAARVLPRFKKAFALADEAAGYR